MSRRYWKPKRGAAVFKLSTDWKRILKRAWSVRFMALAMFFIVAEATLPFFVKSIPPRLFLVLTAAAVAGAFWARVVPQNGIKQGD